MSIIEFYDPPVRKRPPSENALAFREAIALVQPFNDQIGPWQAEAARLSAMAQRGQLSGRYDAGLAEAIETLLGYVTDQQAKFEAELAVSPPRLTSHSRVVDTRNALAMVSQRLRGALPKM